VPLNRASGGGGSGEAPQGLKNRDLSMGKVHVQNHAEVDKAPFFLLKPFKLMVLNGKRAVALFRVEVILETYDETTKVRLEKHLPRLYSALLQDFYGVSFVLWKTGYQTDLMALKKRAERVVRKLVGADILRDVLVQKAVMSPLPKLRRESDI